MSQPQIRLLPYSIAGGRTNMAADEALVLRAATDGVASLRFYGWTTATLSLGYFQAAAVRLSDPRLASLPFVRRPSGGATLVHHHELTYALALPAEPSWQSGESWMPRMHRIIIAALARLGLDGQIEPCAAMPIKHGDVLCFQQHTPGDLLSAGCKVVGSAQRKHRQALLQHGSILLSRSEHTPDLPGIRELCGVVLTAPALQEEIVHEFENTLKWQFFAQEWTEQEQTWIARLAAEKYGADAWNLKR